MIDLGLVAERLINARTTLDLTQDEAAQRTGVSRSTIQRYEAGSPMDLVTLGRLLEGYDLVLTDVIGGQNDLAYLEAAIRRLGPNSCGIICGICKSLGWR
ncbi:MAG: helix-turn-helix transcriptional regulator [Candidatus Thiodiazotropha endolucinida]